MNSLADDLNVVYCSVVKNHKNLNTDVKNAVVIVIGFVTSANKEVIAKVCVPINGADIIQWCVFK